MIRSHSQTMSKLTMQTKGGIPGGFIYPCVGPSSFLGYRLTVRIWFRARATGKRFSFFFKEDGVTWEKTCLTCSINLYFCSRPFGINWKGTCRFKFDTPLLIKKKQKQERKHETI